MGGVLDAQVHVGREGTHLDPTDYGVAVTPTHSIYALSDFATAQRDNLQSVGMRAGLQGVQAGRQRNYIKGWEGSLEVHPADTGFGILLQAAVGTGDIAQVGSTSAWVQTYETGPAAPNESLTFVIGRPPANPAADVVPWTYTGGVVNEFSLEQEVGDGDSGLLKATFGLDGRNELQTYISDDLNPSGEGLPAPAYADESWIYGWDCFSLSVNGDDSIHSKSFSLNMTHSLNTERYYMRGNTFKKQPIRTGVPEFSGSLSFDYENETVYNLVRSSAVVPLVARWEGPIIQGSERAFLQVTCNVKFTGDTPQVSLDDLPNQPIEFNCVWDETNPMVKIEYQSEDVAP